MNVNCIICSDLFTPSDEIYITKCGHAFHQTCLLQWIERSSTCPQCRTKTTEKNIFRVYFNFLNTEGITLDAGALQAKLDNAEFQIKQKDTQIIKFQDEIKQLQKQCSQSDDVLLTTKEKLKTKESAIHGLKEQVDFLKAESKEITKLRSENEKLQNEIDTLKELEIIIYGTVTEVEDMLKSSPDVRQLSVYIVVLKRTVVDLQSKKKMMQDQLRGVQSQLNKSTLQNKDFLSQIQLLTNSLSHAENEIKQLKDELVLKQNSKTDDLSHDESIIDDSFSNNTSKRKHCVPEEAIVPQKSRKVIVKTNSFDSNKIFHSKPSTSKEVIEIVENVKAIKSSSSPYLNLKQSNPLVMSQLKSSSFSGTGTCSIAKTNEFSIFKNRLSEKKKLENNGELFTAMLQKRQERETNFDGLGGHSKPDMFPTINKLSTTSFKKFSSKMTLKRLERPISQSTIKMHLQK